MLNRKTYKDWVSYQMAQEKQVNNVYPPPPNNNNNVYEQRRTVSLNESPPNSVGTPRLPHKIKGLPVPTSSLLQTQVVLSSPGCCSCPSPELRKALQQAVSIGSHHRHTHRPPHLSHHLAQHAITCLPPLSSAHCCHSGLSKG